MWLNFPLYVVGAIACWVLGSSIILKWKEGKRHWVGVSVVSIGSLILFYFIKELWVTLERPPLRTLGETRLLYAAFISIIGLALYVRWRYRWLLIYSYTVAALFLGINILRPEVLNKTLMPALHSGWFVPHVVVYIFSYALLGAASLFALKGLLLHRSQKPVDDTLQDADNIVYIGFAFLTLGLLFGALWAKEAWGHYWAWDPKETWAFITWTCYLIYIHVRFIPTITPVVSLRILALAFVVLLICWFGVNYLPAAQSSVHTYTE
ncbi:MAG: cytochrome c biogenesis protein CcsA [Fibrobacterales bacterium]